MKNRAWRRCLSLMLVAALLFAPAANAQTPPVADGGDPPRPRVGLVLGGGGARGAAHIGVLKELERLRIPVDVIAGTSMGAIVGGLYATGMSADELEQLVATLDWEAALTDTPERQDLSFRRKQDDRRYPVDFEVGLRDGSVVLPKGVIQGQKLDLLLRELTLDFAHISNFDDLPIPLRIVASDIENGELHVMSGGDLARSIRASMSVPGVFAPVRVDGRLLVDGGLVGNLPIDVMQELGVDVIIAVDVEFPLYGPEQLGSALAISEQVLTILIRKDTLRQIDRLGERDVLIRPELGTFGSTDFPDVLETIEPGEAAVRAQADRLAGLALDEDGWRAHVAGRSAQPRQDQELAFVRVRHGGKLAPEVFESRLTVAAGDPIDAEVLEQNAERLYGLQLYEQVDYVLLEEAGGTGVEYRARAKSWGPNVLQFGISLEDDFEGSTGVNVATRMTRGGINRMGAEWRTDLRLGTDPRLRSEFYQPLSFDARYFVAPYVDAWQSNINAFSAEQTIARMRLSEADFGVDIGRELGNVGELRLGVFHGLGEARVKVGAPELENFDFRTGGAFARLRFDTLDRARFPRQGTYADLQWTLSRPAFGADSQFDLVEAEVARTWTRGKSSLQVGMSYATTLEADNAVQDFFPLGGFLRLSGLERGEIRGPHAALGRLVYYRRVGETTGGLLDTPFYLGLSAEAGSTWQSRADISLDSMRVNGSLFAGFDTVIGAVYLAAGFAEQGRTNFYLTIGVPSD